MSRENKKTKRKNEISRKEALIKIGKYAALTSIGTFTILNPKPECLPKVSGLLL